MRLQRRLYFSCQQWCNPPCPSGINFLIASTPPLCQKPDSEKRVAKQYTWHMIDSSKNPFFHLFHLISIFKLNKLIELDCKFVKSVIFYRWRMENRRNKQTESSEWTKLKQLFCKTFNLVSNFKYSFTMLRKENTS